MVDQALYKEIHAKVEEAILYLLNIHSILEEVFREVAFIGVPDIIGEAAEEVEFNGIRIRKFVVIELKTGEKYERKERVKQLSKYLAAVYAYGINVGKIDPESGEDDDVVGIVLRTSGKGVREEIRTKVGPIYVVTPDTCEIFKPLKPLMVEASEDDVEEAMNYIRELVEKEKEQRGRLKSDSPLFKALNALKEAVEKKVLLEYKKGRTERIPLLIKYLDFLRSMTNVLAMADEKYPIRASVLAEVKEPLSRDEVLKAIKERRVVILDVSELLLLHSRGLLRKEDILEIIREGLYRPKGVEDLVELVRSGVLTKQEAIEIIKEGFLPLSSLSKLHELVNAGVLSKEELEAILEEIRKALRMRVFPR